MEPGQRTGKVGPQSSSSELAALQPLSPACVVAGSLLGRLLSGAGRKADRSAVLMCTVSSRGSGERPERFRCLRVAVMPTRGIQHVDLAVEDVERSLAFYYAVLGPLGLREKFRSPTYRQTEEVIYLEYGAQGLGLRLQTAASTGTTRWESST